MKHENDTRRGLYGRLLLVVFALALSSCTPQDKEVVTPDDAPIDVRRELNKRVSVDIVQTNIEEAIDVLFRGTRLSRRQVFVDAIPASKLDLNQNDEPLEKALSSLTRKTNLRWTIRAESVFIGTASEIADIEKTTDAALKNIDSSTLNTKLNEIYSTCNTGTTPFADVIGFVGEITGIKIITRSPVDDQLQRFGFYDFTQGIKLKSLLQFFAVNWRLEIEVEKETIVFVPRRVGGAHDKTTQDERGTK